MKTLKFKTNIKCGGCIAKVTPALNKVEGISKWNVDMEDPQKTLTVETNNLTEDEIIDVLKNAGYSAENV
jgi:copper chaperone